MGMLTWLVGGAFAAAAATTGAQPMPQTHEKHGATGQHQAADSGGKCCCEEMMRKMMTEMMQKHQSMGMPSSKEAPQPDKEHSH